METQETLTERFNALQDAILNLIEEGPTDLKSQILYWELSRKEHATLYYARKEGYNRLGLQPIPALTISEYNAKQAIHMHLLLKSLSKSQYASETWTLTDCSAELINTVPKNCFKKHGYTVEVWYDHDKDKAFPYTNWEEIYYQDATDNWHKVKGKVDENGLYYDEIRGDRVYFMLFTSDADKYGVTGEWTVYYRQTSIVSTSSSSRRAADSSKVQLVEPTTTRDSETPSTSGGSPQTRVRAIATSTSSSPRASTSDIRHRGRGEGERTSPRPKRRRISRRSPDGLASPSPSEVGRGHRLPPTKGLPRLQRLQAEARDPYLLLLKGPANNMKCWRNRLPTSEISFTCSNVWRWLGEGHTQSRMLVAFSCETHRQMFLQTVRLPKNTSVAFGNLDSL